MEPKLIWEIFKTESKLSFIDGALSRLLHKIRFS
jgi:hypothetical protein